jgi:dTDP-4-dehydrorhamnose reductase
MFLLVGGDSEIAGATAAALRKEGAQVWATTRRPASAGPDRPLLDLSRSLDGWELPGGTQAACILAAVARLAACADDPAGSARVNVLQTIALVDRLIARGVYVLFLSTNQVFDGKTPCVPAAAPTCPVSEYGRQKAAAEAELRARMASGAPIGILRLAKVVSPGMALLRQWWDALSEGRPIAAFHDMMMAPVPVDLVAAAIAALMRDRAPGTFQLSGPRDVSYLDLGRHLAERIGADLALVGAMSAHAAGQPPGSTPRHTTLDSVELRDRCGLRVPDAWEMIAKVLELTFGMPRPGAADQSQGGPLLNGGN